MRLIALVGLALLTAFDAQAQSLRNMSIITGPEAGTYHRFGEDIATVIEHDCGAHMEVKPSSGSIETFHRLRTEKYSQLAIVQEDALEYLARSDDATLKEWVTKFKYVFPLYMEEVHLIARKGSNITRLEDLAGRRVAIGETQSGTNLTSAIILLTARISVEAEEIGAEAAIQRLLTSDSAQRIDAMFYVAGKPLRLLSDNDPRLSDLTLVSIETPRVTSKYTPTVITREDYRWLDRDVKTVGVRAVLMSFDFRQEQCDNVGMVANRIAANIEELREKIGHPKWRLVDLDTGVSGWERFACAEQGLKRRVISSGDQKCVFATGTTPSPPPAPGADDQCKKKCVFNNRVNKLCEQLCDDKGQLMR